MELDDGYYYIHCASSPYRVLDVKGNSVKPGAVVQLWDQNFLEAQVWRVRNFEAFWIMIEGRYSGLYVAAAGDVKEPGTRVTSYRGGIDDKMLITCEETGNTVTVGGKRFGTYRLTFRDAGSGLYISADGTRNAIPALASTASEWWFEPVPTVEPDGVYEIRSGMDTNLALDVIGGSTSGGTQLRLWPANGANAQKFIARRNGDGTFRFQNVKSNMNIDVTGAKAANNVPIIQWHQNGSVAQNWKLTPFKTGEIDNRECTEYTFGALGGTTYLLTAQTDLTANMITWTDFGDYRQHFYLLPTIATDPDMPAPYDVGICLGDDAEAKTEISMIGSHGKWSIPYRLSWKSSEAWVINGGVNHFQVRRRSRTMDTQTSKWSDWSDWGDWEPVDNTSSAREYTDAQTVDFDGFKAMEINCQVRSATTLNGSMLVSQPTSQIVRIDGRPLVTLDGLRQTIDGIELKFKSDYPGTTILHIKGIAINGTDILRRPLDRKILGAGAVTVPYDMISGNWEPGNVNIMLTTGTDQVSDFGVRERIGSTIEIVNGTYEQEIKTTTYPSGVMYMTASALGNARAWVSQYDETRDRYESYEAPLIKRTDDDYTWLVPMPSKPGEATLHLLTWDGIKTTWSHASKKIAGDAIRYAWYWNGGCAFLSVWKDARPAYEYSNEAVYEANSLDGREHESVSFMGSSRSRMTASGVTLSIDAARTQTKVFENLVGAHTTFSDINGQLHHAAVTAVSITRHSDYDEIGVSMIEETI